jgi:hypothetical protein
MFIVQGDSLQQFWIGLHYTLVRSPPQSPPTTPPSPLKAIASGFIVLFYKWMWSPSTIFPPSSPLSTSLSYKCSPHPLPIIQSYLSFLIPKSEFGGVSRCIPAMNMLCFGQFNPLCYSLLLLPSQTPLFSSFQCVLFCPLPVQMWRILILLTVILFSLPSSPEFHRVVPLLQDVLYMSSSMVMFVFVYTFIFCVYVSLYIWKKTCSLCVSEPG